MQSPPISTPREWASVVDYNPDRRCDRMSIRVCGCISHRNSLPIFRSVRGHRGSHFAGIVRTATCKFRAGQIVFSCVTTQLLRVRVLRLTILSRRRRRIVLR